MKHEKEILRGLITIIPHVIHTMLQYVCLNCHLYFVIHMVGSLALYVCMWSF
jgi:hypothetical protein